MKSTIQLVRGRAITVTGPCKIEMVAGDRVSEGGGPAVIRATLEIESDADVMPGRGVTVEKDPE